MAKNLLKEVMIKHEEVLKIRKAVGSKSTKESSDLVKKIESGYVLKFPTKFNKKKSFAPSTLTFGHGECARYWYLAFDGADFEEMSDARGIANRTGGTASHERIQEAMLHSGILSLKEFEIKSENPPIYGYGDVLLKWNGTDEFLGEIKTITDDDFKYRKDNLKAKDAHIMQVLIYMKILNKTEAVIIYENKNTHELLAIPIFMTEQYQKWVDGAFEWMKEVRKAWTNKTLPIKNYRSNSKICKYCPVQQACANAETGVIKIKPLEELSETV